MIDPELQQLFAELAVSLRETNASIKEVNVRLAYTEGEQQADRERIRQVEEAVVVLKELALRMDERHDMTEARQAIAVERQAASDARQDTADERQKMVNEALASLARTVDRYINARSSNGDKPKQ